MAQDLKSLHSNIDVTMIKNFFKAGTHFITVYEDRIDVLDNELQLSWSKPIVYNDFLDPQVDFNSLYFIYQQNMLTQIDIEQKLEYGISFLPLLSHYVIQFPFILVETLAGEMMMANLSMEEILWTKQFSCENPFFFSSTEYFGCMNKDSLVVYDTVLGEEYAKSLILNDQWTLISSYNKGAFFSKGSQLVSFQLKTKLTSVVHQHFSEFAAVVRQKEALIVSNQDKEVYCQDLKSDKILWEYHSEVPVDVMFHNTEHIVLRHTTNNYILLDHFTGEEIVSFNYQITDDELYVFSETDSEWFFLFDSGLYELEK